MLKRSALCVGCISHAFDILNWQSPHAGTATHQCNSRHCWSSMVTLLHNIPHDPCMCILQPQVSTLQPHACTYSIVLTKWSCSINNSRYCCCSSCVAFQCTMSSLHVCCVHRVCEHRSVYMRVWEDKWVHSCVCVCARACVCVCTSGSVGKNTR